jgi:hypothetical protein
MFCLFFITKDAKDVCDRDCEYKDVWYSGLSFWLPPVSIEFSIVLVRFRAPAYPDPVREPKFSEPDLVSTNKYRNRSRNEVFHPFSSVFMASRLTAGPQALWNFWPAHAGRSPLACFCMPAVAAQLPLAVLRKFHGCMLVH